jgi:hypothetical protein
VELKWENCRGVRDLFHLPPTPRKPERPTTDTPVALSVAFTRVLRAPRFSEKFDLKPYLAHGGCTSGLIQKPKALNRIDLLVQIKPCGLTMFPLLHFVQSGNEV